MGNREIKFRAYCDIGDENKMLYFTEGKYDNGLWFEHTSNHIDEYLSPLEQFTGMFDKDNNLIYEGDIVQRNETGCDGSYISKYVVVFKENYFGLKIIQSHIFKKGAVLQNMDECEIIGNIH